MVQLIFVSYFTGFEVYSVDLDRSAQHVYAVCMNGDSISRITRVNYDGSGITHLAQGAFNAKSIVVDANDGTGYGKTWRMHHISQ